MRKRSLLTAVLVLLVGFAACDDDDDLTGVDTEFDAQLRGSSEVPPVTTNGSGTATFRVRGDSILFTLSATGFTNANITAAHIHGPAGVGVNAGIIVGLFNRATDGTFPGTVTSSFKASDFAAGQSVTTMAALISLMRQGQTYVNLHTDANPTGEIRGQIAED